MKKLFCYLSLYTGILLLSPLALLVKMIWQAATVREELGKPCLARCL